MRPDEDPEVWGLIHPPPDPLRCKACGDVIPYDQRKDYFQCPECHSAACAEHAGLILDLGFCPYCGKDLE